jgi:UDP-galactopyranose mutase
LPVTALAVLADMYARFRNKRVLVIDHRDHIGGNCYDYVDKETGILMNK